MYTCIISVYLNVKYIFVLQCWYGYFYNICCRRFSSYRHRDYVYGCKVQETPKKIGINDWHVFNYDFKSFTNIHVHRYMQYSCNGFFVNIFVRTYVRMHVYMYVCILRWCLFTFVKIMTTRNMIGPQLGSNFYK